MDGCPWVGRQLPAHIVRSRKSVVNMGIAIMPLEKAAERKHSATYYRVRQIWLG